MGCNTTKEAVPPTAAGDGKGTGNGITQVAPANADEDDFADPNDPEAQAAAVKIQAVFRGHKTRQSVVSAMKAGDADPDLAALEAEFRADDVELCHAATRIQASFRGHMARKTAPGGKEDADADADAKLSQQMEKLDANKAEEEELDIDLTDPDLHKAATKIQASFRGHKVRKEEPTTQ